MAIMQTQQYSIEGPVGTLEALWHQADKQEVSRQKNIAIVCHPLPTQGGTMHNKVVYTLSQVFIRLGISVLRFNTRGTGQSQGEFNDGVGEVDDVAAVAHFAQQVLGATTLWLAGFSFGSYIAYQFARYTSIPTAHLVLVAPPVERYTYQFDWVPPSLPISMIVGDADEIVTPVSMFNWAMQVQQVHKGFSLLTLQGTGHFFHGRLIELRTRLEENLQQYHPHLSR